MTDSQRVSAYPVAADSGGTPLDEGRSERTAPTPSSQLSLWHEEMGRPWQPTEVMASDVEADVAIVGAGYTGLWTAYYLAKADPALRIVVLESHFVGYGASGRNGGWCSAIFPATMRKIAALSTRDAAKRMQTSMNETVLEIEDVVKTESIDCDFDRAGYISVARNDAQWERARREVAGWRSWGFGEDHMRLLDQQETAQRLGASRALGATFTPHCAVLQPAKLVCGLADVVRSLGVRVYEDTHATSVTPGRLQTSRGTVRAPIVVRATEGFTAELPGSRRDIVPMYSLMVATAPLPEELWAEIGLSDRATFSDKRHLRIYGQRTTDGRLAFGGRGAPYHFGSAIKPEFDRDENIHHMLRDILQDFFPQIRGVEFTHAWGGNLGIPRDWCPSVSYDRRTGFAQAGGYVGDGVATANLAGRTLAAEILDRDDEVRSLPWVGRRSPRWEPEPLRWLGVNAATVAFKLADRTEARSGKPSRLAAAFWKTLGH